MTNWRNFIKKEQQQPYLAKTLEYVSAQRQKAISVYPPENQVFAAFDQTPFDQVKVVILGQDPYHGPNQAHGLSFSVVQGVKTPPSLVNIYKELKQDIKGFVIPDHGNLQSWAEQGVLLLNTVLTVEQGKAHSHAKLGWEEFTDHVIQQLNQYRDDIIFLLWGAHAQKKGAQIDRTKHTVLTAPHPSPLSAHRGFFGCHHFSLTNEKLKQLAKKPINWQPEIHQNVLSFD